MSILATIGQSNSKIGQMWKEYQENLTGKPSQTIENSVKTGGQDKNTKYLANQTSDQEEEKDYTIISISNKINSGREISDEDIKYLQGKDSKLYEKARLMVKERESFAQTLQQSETMEEVRNMYVKKMQGLVNEMKDAKKADNIDNMENIKARIITISDEFGKFIKSERSEEIQKNDVETAKKRLEEIVDNGLAYAKKVQEQRHIG